VQVTAFRTHGRLRKPDTLVNWRHRAGWGHIHGSIGPTASGSLPNWAFESALQSTQRRPSSDFGGTTYPAVTRVICSCLAVVIQAHLGADVWGLGGG
jgi:hypothetical protein